MKHSSVALLLSSVLVTGVQAQQAQQKPLQRPPEVRREFANATEYVPDLRSLVASTSELRDVVGRFSSDRSVLMRFENVSGSDARRARLRDFYQAWLAKLPTLDFDRMSQEGKVDYVLLRNYLEYQLKLLDREERNNATTASLVPFAEPIAKLQQDRQKLDFIKPDDAVAALTAIRGQVQSAHSAAQGRTGANAIAPLSARLAADRVDGLRATLGQWYNFYFGYDPGFTQRVPALYQEVTRGLTEYSAVLRQAAGQPAVAAAEVNTGGPAGRGGAGAGGGRGGAGAAPQTVSTAPPGSGSLTDGPIVGNPIGREGLLEDLAGEMIVYTPEQLIAIGEREYEWCIDEMKKASRELGFGDDWLKALEYVKTQYVPRGEQPGLIRDLAIEAENYLEQHGLVTIPRLARDVWRMQMMSAERQRINPFFTGGEAISVSYPTNTMSESDALMSMRGNGIHVSRATVHHELIPGHHLKGFMSDRYNSHRGPFGTPFMGEGWALYWELLLWDRNFQRSPEDRIGMLWWRTHRAARIVFSLNYHLGRWTPEQSIDFLVNNVGHDRFTASGEVRRSFEGNYSPLYQVAYMMGGLQLRALHKEIVGAGKMTDREFHDRVLQAGNMPIEALRALLTNQPLTRDYKAQWKYYGDVAAATRP